MKRQLLITKIETAWSDFTHSYSGLTEEQMQLPGVTGDWSIKDILAHVNAWEGESLKHLPLILEGQRTPRYSVQYGGIDAFNELVTSNMRSLALSKIQDQLDETHSQLITFLENLPEGTFSVESRFRRRLRLDTYSHYPIHTQAILLWREQQGYSLDP